MSRKAYEGTELTVSFDPEVCVHAGECVRGLPAVFEVGRRPWILPDADSAENVIAQVGRCPSGALRIDER